MKQTIYIDVLICLNLFINYLILICSCKFLRIKVNRLRIFLSALTGAVFSFYILLPQLAFWISIPIEFIMAMIIILIGFGFKDKKTFISISACFFSMNFAFAGIMFILWKFFAPPGLVMNNGIVYFNISPLMLITLTIVSYVIIRTFNRITGRSKNKHSFCNIKVKRGQNTCVINAKVDTGNSLLEPFSNLPVAVVNFESIKDILSNEEKSLFSSFSIESEHKVTETLLKTRIIPFKTVSGYGTLLGFKPDFFAVVLDGKDIEKEAYIGVCSKEQLDSNIEALINSELLD